MSKTEPEVVATDERSQKRRKRLFVLLGGIVLKIAVGVGVYAYGHAYTGAETAQVTPAVGYSNH
jgi:hypothetical protein